MSDCKHTLGQGFNIQYMMEYVYCINCKKKWSKEEVTKCLNATDRLSVELCDIMIEDGSHFGLSIEELKALNDYARALEGKDD